MSATVTYWKVEASMHMISLFIINSYKQNHPHLECSDNLKTQDGLCLTRKAPHLSHKVLSQGFFSIGNLCCFETQGCTVSPNILVGSNAGTW